jgi:hypothetical protein
MTEEETPVTLLPLDLQHLSKGALRILAQDPGVDLPLLEQILLQEKSDPETVRCLIRNPSLPDDAFSKVLEDLPEELQQEIEMRQKALVPIKDHAVASLGKKREKPSDKKGSTKGVSIMKRIQQMSPVDKISFALKGTKEARGVLIRDSNKEIAMTVLKNPKITESEVEFYAASTSVSEDIQREIGKNREWCKKYNVLRALVFNSKTPVGVSLEKLPYVKEKDLQFLAKSKSVPTVVSAGAKRMIAHKKKKQGKG